MTSNTCFWKRYPEAKRP